MNSSHKALYDRVQYILLHDWDPIGIRGISRFDDEYDSYIPKVVGLLRDRADGHRLRASPSSD